MNSPSFTFNKYKEGLEVAEILLTETQKNKDFRIDSNFYTKAPKLNAKLNYTSIGAILNESQYGISIQMNEDSIGYPIYRMNEIHNMLCDFDVDKCANISFEDFNKFKLNDRDVLFNRTNSFEWVGRTGIYRKQDDKEFIYASYLVRFVPDQTKVLPEYLTTYLSSKYGVWDVKRRARQSINQTNVNPEEVKAMFIPLLSLVFQEKLKTLFDIAYNNLQESEILYRNAERQLLETLGLKNYTPKNEAVNVKSFSSSFGNSGRLDAEFYQNKYDSILHYLKNKRIKIIPFNDVIKHLHNGTEIRDYVEEDGTRYLRVTDLGKEDINNNSPRYVSKQAPPERLKLNDNCLLMSRSGSLGLVNIVKEDIKDAILSSHIFKIELDMTKISPIFLETYFRSEIGQEFLFQQNNGGVVPEINHEGLKRIPIPILPRLEMEQISKSLMDNRIKVQSLKKESETLLNAAKTAVELAIEQGEETALVWLQKNTPSVF